MTCEDSVPRQRLAVMPRAAVRAPVSQARREFGVSWTLFDRWRKRSTRYDPDGWRPRTPRPTRWPRQATSAREHQVVAYVRSWPAHGPARIAAPVRQHR